MRFFQEFKAFAMRGNVVDLAVGIIIGGAFGTIVNSLVNDILTPVIGVATGGFDFSGLAVVVGDSKVAYGKFLQSTLSFLIIAFALFILVKGMNRLKKRENEKPTQEKVVPDDVKLLTEIRDILAERK